MKEYQKIETLYQFNPKIKKFDEVFFNPIVDYLKNCSFIVSEKIDGTNIRVYWDGHRVSWKGRTDDAELPKEVQQVLQNTFGDSEIIFEQTFGKKEVYLFMECYGGKIQGGIYGGQERLIGFDVMVAGFYLDKKIISSIFDKFGVPTVNFRVVNNLQEAIDYVKEQHISDYGSENKKPIQEGLVCVPACRIYDHQGNRIIVKIKTRDLLKLNTK